MGKKALCEMKKCLQKEPVFESADFLYYFYNMTKLMSYLLPGVLFIAIFALIKTFFISPDVALQEWFVYLTAAITALGVIVPCVIYYLRTPPGVDHR